MSSCARVVVVRGAFVGACLALAGCGEPTTTAEPPAPAPIPYELREVVAARLAALEAPAASDAESPEPAEPEHVEGLVGLVLGADTRMRELALEEAAGLGDALLPGLRALATDAEAETARRRASLQLLAALDTPEAARALLEIVEGEPEAMLRAHAAWRLAETTQDWVAPRLLLRLKYEVDPETNVWLARTLARFGVFTGLETLNTLAATAADERLRVSAWERLQAIAREAGVEDGWSLWESWRDGEPLEVFDVDRSARFEHEVWRWIARFEEYQLRGVDDARYLLARLGPTAAGWLGEALQDTSLYIRVNTAQSLQRMGPRGRPACAALVELLRDPGAGPNAADALGAVACPEAERALASWLAPGTDPELRLACARALGGLVHDPGVGATTLDALVGLLGEGAELRQAAAESLFELGRRESALPVLLECLVDRGLEPATTERVLRRWLAEEESAAAALEAWDALELGSQEVVPLEERRRRRAERRAVVEAFLAERTRTP